VKSGNGYYILDVLYEVQKNALCGHKVRPSCHLSLLSAFGPFFGPFAIWCGVSVEGAVEQVRVRAAKVAVLISVCVLAMCTWLD
jgi:hypothetical protein